MLTRSGAAQPMRFRRSPSEEGSSASCDLPRLPGAQMLDWDHVDPADTRYQPLDSLGFHLGTAGQFDYTMPSATGSAASPHSYPPIHLDSALADASTAGHPPSSLSPWQAHFSHLPDSRRSSHDPIPVRWPAAAAAEDDKRRRNTVASARFRVKKKAREQALEMREQALSMQADQLRERIVDLEMQNKWLRGLLLAKKDVQNGTDAESRMLAQLDAALSEVREEWNKSGDESDHGDKANRERDERSRSRSGSDS